MGFWASIFFVAVSQISPNEDFPPLSRVQEIEIRETWRQLYILGVPYGGIYQEQRERLENIFAAYTESPEALQGDRLKQTLEYAFLFRQSIFEWSYRFENDFGNKVPELYKISRKGLSPSASFLDVLKSLQLQIQMREETLRFPLFADAQFLAGLNAYDLEVFVELLTLTNEDLILLEKMRSQEFLSEEDFIKVQSILSPQTPYDENSYKEYLFLGRLPRLEPLNREEFFKHFHDTSSELSLPKNDFLEFIEFYWALYEVSTTKRWEIHWEDLWIQSEEDFLELPAASWLEGLHGPKWPSFAEARKLSPEEISLAIEDYVELSGHFSETEIQIFRDRLFLSRVPENWEISDIPDHLRPWLAVCVFPSLKLKASLALIEGRFLELNYTEQQEAIFQLPLSLSDQLFLQMEISRINPQDFSQIKNFHRELLKKITAERDSEELAFLRQQEVELISGEQLPKSSKIKKEMREILNDRSLERSYGWFPSWLIEPLIIHVFPHPEYWQMEIKKWKNEWERQEILEQYSQKNYPLSEADKKFLESILFDKHGAPRTDLSSPLVYVSSFAHGFQSHPERILPAMGLGLLFHVVTKGLGWRLVLGVLATDTGIRLISASYLDEEDRSWWELPLGEGYSTPIGLWTAQELQYLYVLLRSLSAPRNPGERLHATHELGSWSMEALSFSVGAGLSEVSVPWKRLARLRSIRKHAEQIKNLASERENLILTHERILERVQILDNSLEQTPQLQSRTRTKQRELRENLQVRLLQTEAPLNLGRRGVIQRTSSGIRLLFRWAGRLYGVHSWKLFSWKKWKGKIETWSYRTRHSFYEIEKAWRMHQEKIARLQDQQALDLLGIKEADILFENLRAQAQALDKQLADFSVRFFEYNQKLGKLRELSDPRKIAKETENLSKEFERLLESSNQVALQLERALRDFESFKAHSPRPITQIPEWAEHIRGLWKAGERAAQTRTDYLSSWSRLQLDWYYFFRQQWRHWNQIVQTQKQSFRSGDFLWDPRLETSWARQMQNEARLLESISAWDKKLAPAVQNQLSQDPLLKSTPSERFLTWSDYLNRAQNSRPLFGREVLDLQGVKEGVAGLHPLSPDQLPEVLRKNQGASQWYRVENAHWIHFIALEESSGKVLSGRRIGGQWRQLQKISIVALQPLQP